MDDLALVMAAQAGHQPSIDRLCDDNRGAIKLAVRCMHPNTDEQAEDLYQEGIIGVLEAIRRYDPLIAKEKGSKFFTYALYWIRLCVKRGADRLYGECGEEDGHDLTDRPAPEPHDRSASWG